MCTSNLYKLNVTFYNSQGSPAPEPASELPIKWVSRLVRILQSPFVIRKGNVPRHDDNVIIFGNYKDRVDKADKSAFLGWFQRVYKPKNSHVHFSYIFKYTAHTIIVS